MVIWLLHIISYLKFKEAANIDRKTTRDPWANITHLRPQFKSIKTFEQSYDYIITFDWERKKPIIPFLRIKWSLFLNVETPSPKETLCQDGLNFAQCFWRRSFYNFVNVFSLFHNYLPLEKDGSLNFPFTQGCFVDINPLVSQVLEDRTTPLI